jgi:hypothetical protein
MLNNIVAFVEHFIKDCPHHCSEAVTTHFFLAYLHAAHSCKQSAIAHRALIQVGLEKTSSMLAF